MAKKKSSQPAQRPADSKPKKPIEIGWGWVVLGLSILVLLLFLNTLTRGHLISGSDQLIAGYMFKSFAQEAVRITGQFPLWNPYIFGGLPYVDAMHGDVFYYTMLLRFIFPVGTVMALVFILQIIAAGSGMFLFLGEIKIKKPVALAGALAFMFTGVIVSFVSAGHDSKVVIASLLPWAMFFIHRGFRLGKILDFALLGLVFGLGLISPNVQLMYYTFLICGFYVLYRMYIVWRDSKKAMPALKPFFLSVASVALGFGISAVQMLPGISYLGFSPRAEGGRGWDFATSWSLPRMELADLLNPRFSGILQNYWGSNAFKQHSEYLGIIIIALMIVGLILAWRRRETKFFAGFGLFGLLMALGGNTPFYYIPYYVLPLIKSFRAPAMIFFTVAFSTVVLAALGLEEALKSKPESSPKPKKRKLNIPIVIFSTLSGLLLLLAIWSTAGPQGFATGLLGSIERTARKTLNMGEITPETRTMAREVGTGMIELGINPPYDARQMEPEMARVFNEVLIRNGYNQFNLPPQTDLAYLSSIARPAIALGKNMKNLANGFWLSFAFLVGGFLMLLGWRKFKRFEWLWGLALGAILFVDLWLVGRHFVDVIRDPYGEPVSADIYYRKDAVVSFLEQDKGLYRVFPLESRQVGPLYREDDYLMLYRIQSLGGYHGNQLRRYQEFIGAPHTILFKDPANLYNPNFLRLLDVRYLIGASLPDSSQMATLTPDIQRIYNGLATELLPFIDSNHGGYFEFAYSAGRNAIYKSSIPTRRVWLASQMEVIRDDQAIIAKIKDASFDPYSTVILEEEPQGWQQSADTTSPGDVRIVNYEPNRIVIDANLTLPAVLVLSENWYPWYRAWVDGKEEKVYRADYTLRAVLLEAGQHEVVFRFRSPYVTVGVWTTFVSLGLVAFAVVLSFISRRNKKRTSVSNP